MPRGTRTQFCSVLAITALVLACASPPAAHAFTVKLTGAGRDKVLTVTSDGASAVKAFATDNGLLEVAVQDYSDPAETVVIGEGCTGRPGANFTHCGPAADIALVVFEGGEGDDRFAFFSNVGPLGTDLRMSGRGGTDFLAGPRGVGDADLDGGAGADTLEGGPGDDVLRGGTGADSLWGGAGSDLLDGGRDADQIDGDTPNPMLEPVAPDDIDVVDYRARIAPVSVLLDGNFNPLFEWGSGGEAGEGDRIRLVEEVLGGAGDDTIRGDTADNIFRGGPGDDLLDGGYGEDQLFGDDGADDLTGGGSLDILDAGPGDDAIDSWDFLADRLVDCDGGTDLLYADNALDAATGCETVAPEFESRPELAGGTQDGSTLSYVARPLTGSPSTLAFQWLWCDPRTETCSAIPGATGESYTLTAADIGKHLALEVTASNAAGSRVNESSMTRAVTQAAPPARGRPIPTPPASAPMPAPTTPVPAPAPPAVASLSRSGTPKLVGGRSARTVDLGRVASCPSGRVPCTVKADVSFMRRGRRVGAGRRTQTIAPGRTARLRFTLTRTARVELLRAGRLTLRLSITSSRAGVRPKVTMATVSLRVRKAS